MAASGRLVLFAWRCAFNRWMQHTDAVKAEGSVADEAKATDLLFGEPEGAHVGTLAGRRLSPADRAVV